MPFKSPRTGSPDPGREPGSPVRLTDPETMRALAHPARIALWQHLGLEGPATATECAPVVGLSPSACSYHLRQLARYGFVEEDPAAAASGRERPWRVRVVSMRVEDPSEPVTVMAARLLESSLDEHWQEARRRYLAQREEYPPEWREAAGTDRVVLYLTPEELAGLREQIRVLYLPLVRLAGEERPSGARPVAGTADFTPMFAPPDRPGE